MDTRREFLKKSVILAGASALSGAIPVKKAPVVRKWGEDKKSP